MLSKVGAMGLRAKLDLILGGKRKITAKTRGMKAKNKIYSQRSHFITRNSGSWVYINIRGSSKEDISQ